MEERDREEYGEQSLKAPFQSVGYSSGDVGHTNGVMARFLDMSWDLILSVF